MENYTPVDTTVQSTTSIHATRISKRGLKANYIGTGALLTIPFTILWYVHLPSALVYTVWAYFTALSYVGTGYIAAGVLLLAFSFFTYMSFYGYFVKDEE